MRHRGKALTWAQPRTTSMRLCARLWSVLSGVLTGTGWHMPAHHMQHAGIDQQLLRTGWATVQPHLELHRQRTAHLNWLHTGMDLSLAGLRCTKCWPVPASVLQSDTCKNEALQCCKAPLKQQSVVSGTPTSNMDQMCSPNLTGKHLSSVRSSPFLTAHKYPSGCHDMLRAASQFSSRQVGGNSAPGDCEHG